MAFNSQNILSKKKGFNCHLDLKMKRKLTFRHQQIEDIKRIKIVYILYVCHDGVSVCFIWLF